MDINTFKKIVNQACEEVSVTMDHQNKGVDVDESELKKLMSKPLIKVRFRFLLRSFQKGCSSIFFQITLLINSSLYSVF